IEFCNRILGLGHLSQDQILRVRRVRLDVKISDEKGNKDTVGEYISICKEEDGQSKSMEAVAREDWAYSIYHAREIQRRSTYYRIAELIPDAVERRCRIARGEVRRNVKYVPLYWRRRLPRLATAAGREAAILLPGFPRVPLQTGRQNSRLVRQTDQFLR